MAVRYYDIGKINWMSFMEFPQPARSVVMIAFAATFLHDLMTLASLLLACLSSFDHEGKVFGGDTLTVTLKMHRDI